MRHIKESSLADLQDAASELWGRPAAPHWHHTSTVQGLEEIRDAYAGGKRALRFLERKPNESSDQWRARRSLFQNVRLVRTICDARAGLLYGTPPERRFFPKEEFLQEGEDPLYDTIESVYQRSNAKSMFRQVIAPARFRDGQSNVKIIFSPGTKEFRLAFLPAECVLWVPDPDDADAIIGAVEIRKTAKGFRMVAHTWDSVYEIDDRWKPISQEEQYVTGAIPIVRFGAQYEQMGSWVDDAVLDQKHLINVRSQFALGLRAQAFSQLFVAGRLKGKEYTGADGEKFLHWSPESVIEGEEGTTAAFLNPGFPLTEAKDVENGWFKTILESYGVSGYTVDPSGAPEQPMALLIKMLRPLQLRTGDIAEFEAGEYVLADVLIRSILEGSAGSLSRESIGCVIEFPENVLPMDKQMERAADAADVAATPPRMTLRDYIKRHILSDSCDDDIDKYLADLQAQAGSVAAGRATVLGALAPRTGILDRIQNPPPPVSESSP
jgi:hypothetical protein